MSNFPPFANPYTGGMQMNAANYWQLFLDTGAPELYLLYQHAKRTEERYVSDDPGNRPSGNGLQ